jgi:hypothetical protein
LSNVLIINTLATNKLGISRNVQIIDPTGSDAGAMNVTYKTVNLGHGAIKYAFPAGAWC